MTRLLNTFNIGREQSDRDYLRGAASVFDLRGDTTRQYNMSRTAAEADSRAIEEDWAAIAADFNTAVRVVEERLDW